MNRMNKGIGTPAAIIIAALVISATIWFTTSFNGRVTKTVTVAPSSIPLREVTFNETGTGCGSYGAAPTFKIDYVPRWYVTLGGITIVQPSNATLLLPILQGVNLPVFAMISKIVFTVPDGSYPYYVSLGNNTYNGTVVVKGSDVVIQVIGPLCT
jgi:hypothetical protein